MRINKLVVYAYIKMFVMFKLLINVRFVTVRIVKIYLLVEKTIKISTG